MAHLDRIAYRFAAVGLLLVSGRAFAQDDVPKGTSEAAKATKGTTDVTSEGKFEGASKFDPEAKDATELAISAGGLTASGNSKLLSATTAGTFRLRRIDNQLSAALAANYTKAGVAGSDSVTTVENFQGKTRYDRFITSNLSLFLGVQGRRDRFQGLDLRMQVDPGVGYYFINDKAQLLWTEVGYDFLHDIRRDDALFDPATGITADKTKTVHSGRLYVGYSNKLNEAVTFVAGIEYLQAIKDTTNWKLAGDAALTSKLAGKFSLATAFSLRYDHNPLAGKQTTDTVTSLSLVYTLL